MRLLPTFIPNFKVVRRVWKEEGLLRIELGKYWEIRFTRALQEDMGYADPPYNKENKGFTRHIKNGHIIPSWYGFSHHDFDTDTYSYMPIPINLIYAALRWIKYNTLMRIKFEWPHWLMKWENRIYRLGQLDGYEMGRYNKEAIKGAQEILASTDPRKNPPSTRSPSGLI